MKHRIVIAEDHTILRDGLRSLLSANNAFAVVEKGLLSDSASILS